MSLRASCSVSPCDQRSRTSSCPTFDAMSHQFCTQVVTVGALWVKPARAKGCRAAQRSDGCQNISQKTTADGSLHLTSLPTKVAGAMSFGPRAWPHHIASDLAGAARLGPNNSNVKACVPSGIWKSYVNASCASPQKVYLAKL